MPDNLLQTGGAGGIGAIFGALASFFGMKGKIENVDKRVDSLTGVVQFKSTCEAVHGGVRDSIASIEKTQTEIRLDIKDILREIRSQQ